MGATSQIGVGRMGLTAACLLAQGRRRKRNPGAGRVSPQHQAQAHEPQRRGESGSQRQRRSGSLPALAPPVPEASISARDPRGHALAPLALVPLLTKDARDGHRHASAVSLHAVCPGWRPPGTRPGSSQEGAEAAGAEATRRLSQCVLSCLFYTLLSRMRREMNRVLAVSGRGWGRGRGVRRTFLAEDEDGKPAPSSHSHRTRTLHMPPSLPPLKCSCHLGGARWVWAD